MSKKKLRRYAAKDELRLVGRLRRYAAKDELRLVGKLPIFFAMLLSLCYLYFTFEPHCGEKSVK
jgi:hypothetical protein